MLKSISLKFTEPPKSLQIPADGITIFVGPNNSGKSLVLREIEADLSAPAEPTTKIVENIDIEWPTVSEVEASIASLAKKKHPTIPADYVYVGRFRPNGSLDSGTIPRNDLLSFIKNKTERRWVASQFLRFFLIRLDGRTRFELTSDQAREDLIEPAKNTLAHIFQDDSLRKKLRDII